MRPRAALIFVLALASACKSEPDFDKRYKAQAAEIDREAERMQNELSSQINAAQQAGITGDNAPAWTGKAPK